MTARKRFAAIGTDGVRPVVWGMGWSPGLAREDANTFDLTWDLQGSCVVEIDEQIADRIKAGEVTCIALGIAVRIDAQGRIAS